MVLSKVMHISTEDDYKGTKDSMMIILLRILIEDYGSYFTQKRDRAGRLGLSPLQKVTAVMRMIAYGVAADAVDDYVRIGETTSIESMKRFVQAVIDIFGENYLRRPNNADISRLLAEGMYARGDHREPSLILEAVASKDLWIWHAFFGLPGSHNDINVLEHSPLFSDLREGRAPPANYSINGHDYTMGYYLADGIYPSWATFVKTIPCPQGPKAKNFAAAQESARKDVERAFGVLQARFAIIRGPARFWDREMLQRIMKACIIMHNMIIEDERDDRLPRDYDVRNGESIDLVISHERTIEFQAFIRNHIRIRDKGTHNMLQADLVEHLWGWRGGDTRN
ncbi:unnamed protein product [Prunus brigantina]